MDDHTQSTSKTTQESTQEQEFTDDDSTKGDDSTQGDENESSQIENESSQISTSSSSKVKTKKRKDVPSIRKRGKYDSDGRARIIQRAYDESFVEARRKKDNAAKRRKLKTVKTKLLNDAVSAVDRKRKALRAVDDTNPPKKRKQSKKYAPIDTPGQRKLTSFVTPSQNTVTSTPATSIETPTCSFSSASKPASTTPTSSASKSNAAASIETQTCSFSSASNQTSTTPTLNSTASFKPSPSAFTSPQAIVPDTVAANVARVTGTTVEVDSISSVGTQLLPNMLARHRGVCNGCMLQFHVCHEAKWRDTCLHAVVDYFDTVGYDMITPHGIREAFYNRYIALAKTELLKGTEYYELNDDMPLPSCMIQGSLTEALQMIEYNNTFRYLESRRMHDVKGYMRNRNNPPEIDKKRFGDDG